MIKTINKTIFVSLTLLFLVISGCKEGTVAPVTDNNVSVGYTVSNSNPNNYLLINEAKFLLRDIELIYGPNRDAVNLNIGPHVVYMDLTQGTVSTAGLTTVPTGQYYQIRFLIDVPLESDRIDDPEFINGSAPAGGGYSVIAKGVHNSAPFVYKSSISFEATIDLENAPLNVSDAALLNITISVDVNSWFMRNGMYLDPSDPNNSEAIDYNVKASFKKAFRDLNSDGLAD